MKDQVQQLMNYKDQLYVIGGQQKGLKALNINEILNIDNSTINIK